MILTMIGALRRVRDPARGDTFLPFMGGVVRNSAHTPETYHTDAKLYNHFYGRKKL